MQRREGHMQGAVELADMPSVSARRQGKTRLSATSRPGRAKANRSSHNHPAAHSSLTQPLLSEGPCQADEPQLLISSHGKAGPWVVVHHATQHCSVPDERLKPFQWSRNRHLVLGNQQSTFSDMQSMPSAAYQPAYADQHASTSNQSSSHAEPQRSAETQQQCMAAHPQRGTSAAAQWSQPRYKAVRLRWSKRGVVRHQGSPYASHARGAATWTTRAHAGLNHSMHQAFDSSTAHQPGQVWNDPYPCTSSNCSGQSSSGSAMPPIRMQTVLMDRAPVPATPHSSQLQQASLGHDFRQQAGVYGAKGRLHPNSSQTQQASFGYNARPQAGVYAGKSRLHPGPHMAASTGMLRTTTETAIWAAAARLAGSGPLFSL